MKTIQTNEDFKTLEIGTKIYAVSHKGIEGWVFLGINPIHPNYALLQSRNDVQKIKGIYLGFKHLYYTDYKEACHALLEEAKNYVKLVEKIYIKN